MPRTAKPIPLTRIRTVRILSRPIIKPIAEKVPNNLDISKYAYDPATESCNADMMMVGDSVTSGTSDAIQAAFPNAFIDGLPNRQLPQAVNVYQQDTAAGHSGSVVVFGLGTNGVISNEQEVQQLIDLTGRQADILHHHPYAIPMAGEQQQYDAA